MLAPAIFLLTAVHSKECIEEMAEYFDDDWMFDFSMSLTMMNEKHVYGSAQDILEYIDSNSHLFQSDNQEKKFSVLVSPKYELLERFY
jgi:hypothetical protein